MKPHGQGTALQREKELQESSILRDITLNKVLGRAFPTRSSVIGNKLSAHFKPIHTSFLPCTEKQDHEITNTGCGIADNGFVPTIYIFGAHHHQNWDWSHTLAQNKQLEHLLGFDRIAIFPSTPALHTNIDF